jgi:hypothetical protein
MRETAVIGKVSACTTLKNIYVLIFKEKGFGGRNIICTHKEELGKYRISVGS